MKNASLPAPGASPDLEVNISADLASVEVMHHGRRVVISVKLRSRRKTWIPQ